MDCANAVIFWAEQMTMSISPNDSVMASSLSPRRTPVTLAIAGGSGAGKVCAIASSNVHVLVWLSLTVECPVGYLCL